MPTTIHSSVTFPVAVARVSVVGRTDVVHAVARVVADGAVIASDLGVGPVLPVVFPVVEELDPGRVVHVVAGRALGEAPDCGHLEVGAVGFNDGAGRGGVGVSRKLQKLPLHIYGAAAVVAGTTERVVLAEGKVAAAGGALEHVRVGDGRNAVVRIHAGGQPEGYVVAVDAVEFVRGAADEGADVLPVRVRLAAGNKVVPHGVLRELGVIEVGEGILHGPAGRHVVAVGTADLLPRQPAGSRHLGYRLRSDVEVAGAGYPFVHIEGVAQAVGARLPSVVLRRRESGGEQRGRRQHRENQTHGKERTHPSRTAALHTVLHPMSTVHSSPPRLHM